MNSRTRLHKLHVKYDATATTDAAGTLLYTSNSRYHGICAYECKTNTRLWQRKDLGNRSLKISKTPPLLYAFSAKSCEVLNRETGRSKRLLRGVHELWESPHDGHVWTEKQKKYFLLRDNEVRWGIDRSRGGALDVCFSADSVFLTEVGGPIRCHSLADGSEIWRHTPPKNSHCLRLAYLEGHDALVGVLWDYSVGGPQRLVHFSPETGAATEIAALEAPFDSAFCCNGLFLATYDGRVVGSLGGEIVGRLPPIDE